MQENDYLSKMIDNQRVIPNECHNAKDAYFICLENDGQMFSKDNNNCQNQYGDWKTFCNTMERKKFLFDRYIINQRKETTQNFIQ
jgi:hypothetical protein